MMIRDSGFEVAILICAVPFVSPPAVYRMAQA
jgi:hypothetical protein